MENIVIETTIEIDGLEITLDLENLTKKTDEFSVDGEDGKSEIEKIMDQVEDYPVEV